jgi:hypothetical protein
LKIKGSGTKMRGNFDLIKKLSIKIYLKENVVVVFTTHVNPRKLLEKSGTKSERILVFRPSEEKM